MKKILAGLSLAFGCAAASAALVSYNFSATYSGSDVPDVFSAQLNSGTQGAGSFTIDGSLPGLPFISFMQYPGAVTSVYFAIPGITTISGGNGMLQVGDETYQDFIELYIGSFGHGTAAATNLLPAATGVGTYIGFAGDSSILIDENIPDADTFTNPNWSTSEFRVYLVRTDGGTDFLSFNITAIEQAVEAVPEPGSLILVGAGLVGLVAMRRRSKPVH